MTDPEIFRDFTARTGRIICQLCCEDYEREDMQPVSVSPELVWDVCRNCAVRDGGDY